MPEWARRRKEEQDAERARRWQARVETFIGDLLPVDALWSNASLQPFCVACRAYAEEPVIEMGLEPATPCTHCGQPVGAAVAGKVN